MLAGFVKPTSGHIRIEGQNMNQIPPHRRNLGMVFQDYSLFPHLTVFQNIAFGLRMRKLPKEKIRDRVISAMETVRLKGLEERMPDQLSGGQRQRVALARAIVIKPYVLLLDEPLGALDRKLREEMQVEIRNIHDRLGITTIFVTHDQDEALSLADRVAIMRNGKVEQIGSPTGIYESPVNTFVAEFLGKANIIQMQVKEIENDYLIAEIFGNHLVKLPSQSLKNVTVGDQLRVLVRPERIECNFEDDLDDPAYLSCEIEQIIYMGTFIYILLNGPGSLKLLANVPVQLLVNKNIPEVKQKVFIHWQNEANIILEKIP
jgi:ABC-type Fe3+/spermidine/putrescine transport system ATPase subunit